MDPERFAAVIELHPANHDIDDDALRSLSALLPSLEALTLFGSSATSAGLAALVRGCPRLRTLTLIHCAALSAAAVLEAGVVPAQLPDLREVLVISSRRRARRGRAGDGADEPPIVSQLAAHGLSACGACGAWFPSGSRASQCLYHPGEYSGYGASCSSFSCCGSQQPGYPCSNGCKQRAHVPVEEGAEPGVPEATRIGRMPVIELMQTPYDTSDVDFAFHHLHRGGVSFWLRDACETRGLA